MPPINEEHHLKSVYQFTGRNYFYINIIVMLIEKIAQWLPRNRISIFGKNQLVKSPLPYYTMAFIIFLSFLPQQYDPFMFLGISYAFFPLLDELFSLDNANPSEKEKKQLMEKEGHFLAPLFAAIILSWMFAAKVFYIIQATTISWYNLPRFLAIIYIISNLYAVQFITAHELIHRPGKFNQFIGKIPTISLYYGHFTYFHLKTHHILVATPLDPACPRKGETLYTYLPKVVIGMWMSVYNDQKKEGKSFFKNTAITSIMLGVAFTSMIYYIWGLQVAICHCFMAFGAIIYLQIIGYIQHYGLLRKKLPNGQYEKVTVMHSWNAPHRFTNYFLFKVQRHSDHHEDPSKPYQALASLELSPFLPHGYSLMILMACFPKTWFRIIDPILEEYREIHQGRKAKANPEVINLAMTETRKFLIKVALSASLLLVASILKLI